MTTGTDYAWLTELATAWFKAERAKDAKPRLVLVSATPQHHMQCDVGATGTNHCTASNDLIEEGLTMTTTVFPPDEGYSFFDASPAQIATRISCLNLAAHTVLTGDALADKRLVQEVCTELMETAAWLARKLANYHDDLDHKPRSA